MSPEKLVYMANQIGKFFAHRCEEDAVRGISEHIESFWEKRMLSEMCAYLDAGGGGLDALPKRALQSLCGDRCC